MNLDNSSVIDNPVTEEEQEISLNVTDPSKFEYTISDGKVTITKYIGNDREVVVPDEIDGNPVTSIGYRAFYDCDSLTTIDISDSVTSIGNGAFMFCSSLTSINIPEGVTSIGGSAFEYCSSLTSIKIPDTVTEIYSYAFSYCDSLTSVTIPESVMFRGDHGAFIDCVNLKTAGPIGSRSNYEFGWTSEIPGLAFEGCSDLVSVDIPNSITSIGGSAFLSCESLTSINIPEGVTFIGSFAFCGCSSLTSITIPEGVTKIGWNTFGFCSSLTSVVLPEGVTIIDGVAFQSCESLTSINIPEGVTSIGDRAFNYCNSLTSITIPSSVSSIGEQAFTYCGSLTNIIVSGSNTIYDSRDNCNAIINTQTNSLIQGCKNTIVPTTVTSIGDNAFCGNDIVSINLIRYSPFFPEHSAFSGTVMCPDHLSCIRTVHFAVIRMAGNCIILL